MPNTLLQRLTAVRRHAVDVRFPVFLLHLGEAISAESLEYLVDLRLIHARLRLVEGVVESGTRGLGQRGDLKEDVAFETVVVVEDCHR